MRYGDRKDEEYFFHRLRIAQHAHDPFERFRPRAAQPFEIVELNVRKRQPHVGSHGSQHHHVDFIERRALREMQRDSMLDASFDNQRHDERRTSAGIAQKRVSRIILAYAIAAHDRTRESALDPSLSE